MKTIVAILSTLALFACAHGRSEAPAEVIELQDEAEAGPIEPGEPNIGEED